MSTGTEKVRSLPGPYRVTASAQNRCPACGETWEITKVFRDVRGSAGLTTHEQQALKFAAKREWLEAASASPVRCKPCLTKWLETWSDAELERLRTEAQAATDDDHGDALRAVTGFYTESPAGDWGTKLRALDARNYSHAVRIVERRLHGDPVETDAQKPEAPDCRECAGTGRKKGPKLGETYLGDPAITDLDGQRLYTFEPGEIPPPETVRCWGCSGSGKVTREEGCNPWRAREAPFALEFTVGGGGTPVRLYRVAATPVYSEHEECYHVDFTVERRIDRARTVLLHEFREQSFRWESESTRDELERWLRQRADQLCYCRIGWTTKSKSSPDEWELARFMRALKAEAFHVYGRDLVEEGEDW